MLTRRIALDIQALQQSLRRYAEELLRFADETAIAIAEAPGARTHVLVDWENVQPSDAELRALVPEATDLWLFHGPNQKHVAEQHAAFGDRATPIRIARTGKNALDFHLSFYIGYIASRQPEARFVVVSNDKGYEPMLDHVEALGFAARRVGFARVKATRTPAKRRAPVTAKKAAVKVAAAPKPVPAKKAPARKAAAKPAVPKSSAQARKAAVKKVPATQRASKPPTQPTAQAKRTYAQVLAMLQKRPATRLPRKPASLLADIAQMIGTEASGVEAAAILDRLAAAGHVTVDAAKRSVRYAL